METRNYTPSGAEVDPLKTIDLAISARSGTRVWLHLTRANQLRTAVATLLTREAALVAEVAGLREDIADRKRVIECKNIDIRERDASLHGWAERAKKAEDERDALAAEVGALRLDAERYRWLRDVSVPPHNFYISVPVEFTDVRYTPAQVDAEISAAIAARAKAGT